MIDAMDITFLQLLVVGVAATAALDLWTRALRFTFGLPVANWALVGRWAARLLRGELTHSAISKVAAVRHEGAIGWTVHYGIGIAYSVIYWAICRMLDVPVSLLSGLAFGVATVLAPWFILQPGLGLGFFASRAPNPNRTRLLNLLNHAVFGITLYAAWRLL